MAGLLEKYDIRGLLLSLRWKTMPPALLKHVAIVPSFEAVCCIGKLD
jgi:hypothetical protein